jgi:mercuric ion transport protein
MLGAGAGLASTFEPLRLPFTALAIALLAVGFTTVHGRRAAACAEGSACAVPRRRGREKVVLWTAAVLTIALLSFPEWSKLLV